MLITSNDQTSRPQSTSRLRVQASFCSANSPLCWVPPSCPCASQYLSLGRVIHSLFLEVEMGQHMDTLCHYDSVTFTKGGLVFLLEYPNNVIVSMSWECQVTGQGAVTHICKLDLQVASLMSRLQVQSGPLHARLMWKLNISMDSTPLEWVFLDPSRNSVFRSTFLSSHQACGARTR